MNKVLRTALVAVMVLFAAPSVFAQAVGDKIKYSDKVYQVVSENLITNGAFDDGFTGWTGANDYSTTITEAGFEIRQEEGKGNYLVGTTNSDGGDAKSLGTAWAIETGKTYYYAYDVKSINTQTGEAGYLKSSLTNMKGEETSVLGMPTVTPGQWTAFENVFTNDEYQYCQVKFRWLAGNFGFDNFRLFEVVDFTAYQKEIEEVQAYWQEVNTAYYAMLKELNCSDKVDDIFFSKMNEANQKLVQVNEQTTANPTLLAEAKALIDEAKDRAAAHEVELKKAIAAKEVADAIPAGEYYFMTTDGKFFGPGNDWGTQASLVGHSVPWQLATEKDGIYTLESVVSNGGKDYYFTGSYCDGPATPVYISKAGKDTYYLSMDDGKNYLTGTTTIGQTNNKAEALEWKIVSTAASFKKGDDITFLIKDANFDRNNRYSNKENNDKGCAWTIGANTNLNLSGGTNVNRCAESWHSVFSISQKINVPAGYYTVSAQAFYSQDGTDTKNLPVLFAGDKTKVFPARTGTEDNMDKASNSFSAGKYTFKFEFYFTGGELEVGVKLAENKALWCIWDNIGLVYHADDATAFNNQRGDQIDELWAELNAKNADSKVTISGYAEGVQKAVKADQDAVDAAILKFFNENMPGGVVKVKKMVKEGDKEVEKEVEESNGKDYQKDFDFEGVTAGISELSAQIDAVLAKAKTYIDDQTELNNQYEALKTEWQDAYDLINAKYKEVVAAEELDTYLKNLSNIDYAANKTAIDKNFNDGTLTAKKAELAAAMTADSQAIKAVVAGAAEAFDNIVTDKNAKAFAELQAAYDKNVAVYADAINTVNAHLSEYHKAIATEANTALYAIYKDLNTTMATATADYEKTVADNEALKAKGSYPSVFFDPAPYTADLNKDVTTEVNAILATAIADATAENNKKYAEYDTKFKALATRLGKIDGKLLAKADAEKLDKAVADLAKYQTEVLAKYADNEKQADVEGSKCIIEDAADIDAKYAEFETVTKELEDAYLVAQNASELANLKKATDAAEKALKEALPEKYAESVKTLFADTYNAIANTIAGIVTSATADDAAKKLVTTAAGYYEQLGTPADLPAGVLATAEDFETLETNTSYKTGLVTTNGWKVENAAVQDNAKSAIIPGNKKAVCINGKTTAVGTITSPLIKGGITSLTINYGYIFAETNGVDFKVELVKNDDKKTVIATQNVKNAELAKEVAAKAVLEFKDVKDDLFIVITNNCPSASTGNKDRYSIWGITWTSDVTPVYSVYANINALTIDAKNEQAKLDGEALVASLTADREAAEAVIGEKLDAVKKDITALSAAVKAEYDAKTIAANYDTNIKPLGEAITAKINAALSDFYKADLAQQIVDLKTTWNLAYANNGSFKDVDLDEVNDEITDLENRINAEAEILQKKYDAYSEEIRLLTLMLTDYNQWLEETTVEADANRDGVVNVTDITLMVKFILGTAQPTYAQMLAADINGDEEITVADLQAAINIILGIKPDAAIKGRDASVNNDYLVVEKNAINLVNSYAYASFQMDITLANGATLNGVNLSERAEGFTMAYSKIGANTYRVVGYQLAGETIADNEGVMLTLDINGTNAVKVSNAIFADAQAKAYTIGVADATGINGLAVDLQNTEIFGTNGARRTQLEKGVNILKSVDGTVRKIYVK